MSDRKIGSVLVVGGGIGGMQASLDLADSGFKVHLVEKESSIGGTMVKLDKTFPTGDCAMCMISPKMVEVGRHPNIEIRSMAEVIEVSGAPGDFKVGIREKARSVDPAKCTGCGECTRACPVRNVIQIPPKKALPVMEPEWAEALDEVIAAHAGRRSALIAMLQKLQTRSGYLPRALLANLADRVGIPESEVIRVASFYSQFRFIPPGRNQIRVCMGTACFVRGSTLILEAVTRKIGIESGQTTDDRMFSLERVACFGSCALAPVVVVNETVYGGVTPAKMEKLIDKIYRGEAAA